jgi:hypothetical protein
MNFEHRHIFKNECLSKNDAPLRFIFAGKRFYPGIYNKNFSFSGKSVIISTQIYHSI